jgi:uncharacterized membrane protein YkvA (DUF1232 family)
MSDPPPGLYARFKASIKSLKRELLAVHYAVQDPSTGWPPRIIAALAIAYALSPFDLIPDFIPVLGLIDDLIILPAMLWLAIYLIPDEAMERGRVRAEVEPLRLAKNWVTAALFFAMWNVFFGWAAWAATRHWGTGQLHDAAPLVAAGVVAAAVTGEVVWAVLQIRKERQTDVEQPLLAEP